jgi:hypothetical protein
MSQPRIHWHPNTFRTTSPMRGFSNASDQAELARVTKNARSYLALIGIIWSMILPLAVACLVGCVGFSTPKSPAGASTSTTASSLRITTNALPAGAAQSSYGATLIATGGHPPYSWSQTGGQLPTGLTLNPITGAIVGAPTSSGTFSFTAKVIDSSSRSASAALSLDVSTAPSSESLLRIVTNALPVGAAQHIYSAALVATGGAPPYSWTQSGGKLPTGLALNSGTGIIAGTPSLAGNFSFTTNVHDSKASSVSTGFSLNISTAPSPTVSGFSPNSGSTTGGTSVTIGGSNFSSGVAVVFGSLPAQSVRVMSSSEIQAVTPVASAGKVAVTVQESDGQVAAASNAFTFTAPAAGSPAEAAAVNADVVVDAGQTVSETGGDDLAAAKNIYASASAPESNGGLAVDWNLISSQFTMKRMRNINGLGDCALDGNGNLTGCTRLDGDLRSMKAVNLTPHVVVGQWAPSSIGGNPLQWGASQWAQYDTLCYAIVNHVANQFGGTGFSEALFEVENELDSTMSAPDLWLTTTPNVPQGDPSRYKQFDTVYSHWAKAVETVAQQNPSKKIRIAGPATGFWTAMYGGLGIWQNQIIEKYAKAKIRMDVVSLHYYGSGGNLATYAQSIRSTLNANGNSKAEIWITEWGASDVGSGPLAVINGSNEGAAWAVNFLLQAIKGTITGGSFLLVRDNQGADMAGVNSNMNLASWNHVQPTGEYPKAIANAFSMVDRMTGTRRSVSVNSAKPDLNALSSSSSTSASVIVSNYNYISNYQNQKTSDASKNENVTVGFKNLPFSGSVTVDRYLIDAQTSNLQYWLAAGKTPPSVQAAQLQKVESFSATSTGGTIVLPTRELGQSAVSLWIVHQ